MVSIPGGRLELVHVATNGLPGVDVVELQVMFHVTEPVRVPAAELTLALKTTGLP
jgi:hypothetical protein